jgi:RNA polymerase sigma factor (sigma-70 family)
MCDFPDDGCFPAMTTSIHELSDPELLTQFVGKGSGEAFSQLVERYLPLVYSAALRQLQGNSAAAEDVAQAVFVDLARKASKLTARPALTPWLFTATRFQVTTHLRNEFRRQRREEQAFAMNELLDGPNPDWDQVREVLDASMLELNESDREVLLGRFFDRLPMAALGARFGISENTARMRVERALDKLRTVFLKQGITSGSAALAVLLTENAVVAVPVGLNQRISRAALSAGSIRGLAPNRRFSAFAALTSFLLQIARTKPMALIGAVSLLLVISGIVWSLTGNRTSVPPRDELATALPEATASQAAGQESPVPDPVQGIVDAEANPTNRLLLTFVAADSGQPVPGVEVTFVDSVASGTSFHRTASSLRNGTCPIPFSPKTTKLKIQCRADQFADTALEWEHRRGETVPAQYRVELSRPIKIGGTVVDADGQLVSDAEVFLGPAIESNEDSRPQNHVFDSERVRTDAAGHWEINRIASEMVRRVWLIANHPQYPNASAHVSLGENQSTETEARKGTLVLRLGSLCTVVGRVLDDQGSPVPDATIFIGIKSVLSSDERHQTTSDANGEFTLPDCSTDETTLSAEKDGFTSTTQKIALNRSTGPFNLILKPGKTLRLRVVSRAGEPIQRASVFVRGKDSMQGLDTLLQNSTAFSTDEQGCLVWNSAPDSTLSVSVAAHGFMTASESDISPDDVVHTVTLGPGLKVHGMVTDSNTGKEIPRFRLRIDWLRTDGLAAHEVSAVPGQWQNFGAGKFEYIPDGLLFSSISGAVLKIEADGYNPFASRAIALDEGDVRLDVRLETSANNRLTLLQPNGRPAAGAQVAFVTETSGRPFAYVILSGNQLSPSFGSAPIQTADSQGVVVIPHESPNVQIVATHQTGFIQIPASQLAGQDPITLQPWGEVKGTVLKAGRPQSDQVFILSVSRNYPKVRATPDNEHIDTVTAPPFSLDTAYYQVKSDLRGEFKFQFVPPGSWSLSRSLDTGVQTTAYLTPEWITNLLVEPGFSQRVALNVSQRRVVVQLAFPTNVEEQFRLVMARLTLVHSQVPDRLSYPPADDGSSVTPENVYPSRNFTFVAQPDGSYAAEGVEAGTYSAYFVAGPNSSGSLLSSPSGRPQSVSAQVEDIVVPANPSDIEISLGTVTLGRPSKITRFKPQQ